MMRFIKPVLINGLFLSIVLNISLSVHARETHNWVKHFGDMGIEHEEIQPKNSSSERIYKIWDDRPAPNRGGDFNITKARGYPYDEDWELYSYPIGNGYMGANIFGRTDTERIQLTEKTLANEGLYGIGGLTSFAEINFEINHENPTNYSRSVNINEAIAYVNYTHDGIEYTREHFISYPDNVCVIKFSANKKGKISFTLRPEIPYLRDSTLKNTRTGKMEVDNNVITLSGFIDHFSVNYEGQIKVINDGGTLTASQKGDKSEISVSEANSVVILIAAATNYELSKALFLEDVHRKKLDPGKLPHDKVSKLIKAATNKGFDKLRTTHLKDYQNLFSRVRVKFNKEIPDGTTRELLKNYQSGTGSHYLEELMFHYGRYLLISTSRKGALPCGLQGVWSQYEVTPFTGGFWHNINVQMNYWGAFNTNLTETFTPYVEFFEAYLPKAKSLATEYLKENNPKALAKDSLDNGWTIGTGTTPYKIVGPGGHSGPGTGALTTKMFWDNYEFTMDTAFLLKTAYPAIEGMSRFLSKTLVPYGDSLLLVYPSASPEQKHNGENYITAGTTFDQALVWENHHDLLKAGKILGIHNEFIDLVQDQITKLDPIIIGKSGQIKEFREEAYYGEIGQKEHRHISHLCALYPGTLINSSTKDWMDASIVTLDLRGNNTTGWAMAHRMNARARTRDGEKAYEVYSKFIRERTLPNLWTTHPPFQIDGNFGCMAGVAEMLLQSHEGYIEPLAALPEVWDNGEYRGLVARGNFEISVVWKDGKATSIEVLSRSGGECRLKYQNIAGAKLTNRVGQSVTFQSSDPNSLSFVTEKGKMYTFTCGID
jgi:alpha-L-fucosidase 2